MLVAANIYISFAHYNENPNFNAERNNKNDINFRKGFSIVVFMFITLSAI